MPGENLYVKGALIPDRVRDLEQRVREKVKVSDAELRSRIACELLGPLRDVPPSVWALVVLAERQVEALANLRVTTDGYERLIATEQTFEFHLRRMRPEDIAQALVALGKLQRVPR